MSSLRLYRTRSNLLTGFIWVTTIQNVFSNYWLVGISPKVFLKLAHNISLSILLSWTVTVSVRHSWTLFKSLTIFFGYSLSCWYLLNKQQYNLAATQISYHLQCPAMLTGMRLLVLLLLLGEKPMKVGMSGKSDLCLSLIQVITRVNNLDSNMLMRSCGAFVVWVR